MTVQIIRHKIEITEEEKRLQKEIKALHYLFLKNFLTGEWMN